MRSIVLFQTAVNIVLAITLIFLVHQIDRKVGELSGVELLVAKSLTETTEINDTLAQILLTLKAHEASQAQVGQ